MKLFARARQVVWLAGLLFFALAATAAEPERGVMVRQAQVYLSPDASSSRLDQIPRGREVVILEHGRGWLHVFANVERGRDITGWILDKGVVTKATPLGDRIIFGEAVDSESEAQVRRGRKNAAEDAGRLYYRLYEYFPQSPLAGEALWRAADIRWQIDKADLAGRPSSREADPGLRSELDESLLKEVRKKFSGTRWDDLAAFDLLDRKLCGEWQAQSKCPRNEAESYEDYVKNHPNSPKVAEALYEAARRYAALVEIYKTEGDPKKSEEAKLKAVAIARQAAGILPQSDWTHRAARLAFLVEQGVSIYGSGIE